jgi:hypothetical protein
LEEMVEKAEALLASKPDWSKAEARQEAADLIGFFNATVGRSHRKPAVVQPPVYHQLVDVYRQF